MLLRDRILLNSRPGEIRAMRTDGLQVFEVSSRATRIDHARRGVAPVAPDAACVSVETSPSPHSRGCTFCDPV
jgi:hypothetical protein